MYPLFKEPIDNILLILIMLLYLFIFYFIFFALYLELNPSITNIWYRYSDDGLRHFYPLNLFSFIIEPFYKIELWYPSYWDLNFFIGILFVYLFYLIYSFLFNKYIMKLKIKKND